MELEIVLIAAGAAAVVGFFLGKRGEGPKDHQNAIASLALLTREDRAAVLNSAAISTGTLPKAMEVTGASVPPLPLFTDDEKKAILKEVADYQKAEVAKGHFFSQYQFVTPDEVALKPPPPSVFPTKIMAGAAPIRLGPVNLRR